MAISSSCVLEHLLWAVPTCKGISKLQRRALLSIDIFTSKQIHKGVLLS